MPEKHVVADFFVEAAVFSFSVNLKYIADCHLLILLGAVDEVHDDVVDLLGLLDRLDFALEFVVVLLDLMLSLLNFFHETIGYLHV